MSSVNLGMNDKLETCRQLEKISYQAGLNAMELVGLNAMELNGLNAMELDGLNAMELAGRRKYVFQTYQDQFQKVVKPIENQK